jgi:hypothetical protein
MVRIPLRAKTKIGAVKELIDAAAEVHSIRDTLDLLQSVLNQDALRSCRIVEVEGGPSAVFVHARSPYCPVSFVGVGVAREDLPLVIGRPDTFRILVLWVATHGDVTSYVWMQGQLLRLLSGTGLRRSLSCAKDAGEVLRLLCDAADGRGGIGKIDAGAVASPGCARSGSGESPGQGKVAL